MKNKYLFFLAFLVFANNFYSQAQTESPPTEMTDGPQTLPTDSTKVEESIPDLPSVEDTKDSGPTEETKTEETKAEETVKEEPAKEEPKIEELKTESLPSDLPDTKEETKQPDKKKPEVLSEEELLKPIEKKETKDNSKIKASKINESEIYIQEAEKFKLTDIFKNLQLNDVIEQGLRKNYDQNIRDQKEKLTDISFSGTKDAFWLPHLKVSLQTESQKISTLHSSSRQGLSPTPKTPNGVFGLSLGDYTVFNWGKDFATYLNQKSSFNRDKQIYEESKRELKLDLIERFFRLLAIKNIEKIRQDQLRHASFVYRLNKEKITIGKTSKQDYYQARSEYLIAQNEYHQAKMDADLADENMAFLIADEVGTKYILSESLDYRRLKISLDDTLDFSGKRNPTILTNTTTLENNERSYEIAMKDNMPLPKFTVNLGAYNKRFGTGVNSTLYENTNGGNVELVASINASWDIIGEDGLLNSNKLATSRINKEVALKELEKSKHYTQSLVRQTFKNIMSLQNQIVILEARLPSVQKTFDVIIDNYLASKTKYIDFHYALKELTESKILYEQTKLAHLQDKISLAKLAGIEDFPGENFEQLAIRTKGK